MSKSSLDHTLSSNAHIPFSPPRTTDHATPLLDDDSDGAFGRDSFHFASDPSNTFGAAESNNGGAFNSAGSDVVLYSSDISNPTVHGAPHVIMAAGGSHGSSVTGAATTSSTDLVSSLGLSINITWDSSVGSAPTEFKNVVLQVAQYFVNNFTDHVTLNINVGYGESGGYSLGGALGMSLTNLLSTNYTTIKNQLTADSTTQDDATAVAHLPGSDPIGGSHNYWVSTAEAKALGLYSSTTNIDGYVGFSNTAGIFDYDNTASGGGVSSNQYDFFGVVAHEFSEVMGRILLTGGTISGSTTSYPNSYDALDLFHFSGAGSASYFSIDGGVTDIKNFNTVAGGDLGDWTSSATANAFDAFGTPGKVEPISAADLTALDAIGWNAASSGNPPPPPPPTQPDLTASILSLHDTTLSLQFTNIGTGVAAASTAGLYLSINGTITTSDTLFATIAIPTLAAGASISGNVTVPFPSNLAAGTYHLGVIADYNGQIAEGTTGETNNSAVVSMPIILGNSGNNLLTGGSGAEEIIGLGSSDTLIGNGGVDTLIGGSGSDHFRYNSTADGGGPGDLIADFAHNTDVLDFSRLAFGNQLATGGTNTGTLDLSHFAANSDGHATAATAQFIYNTTSHVLTFDSDGTGGTAAINMAKLENSAALTFSDIHLV